MEYNYAKADYKWRSHIKRYKKYVENMPKKLICQECGGSGKVIDDYVEWYPIYLHCGWCNGTGLLTPWLRGQWLKYKREEKRNAENEIYKN